MKLSFDAVSSKDKPALKAAEWLVRSGIQNTDPHSNLLGGVYAWFDRDTKSYPFVYSEITGYAVNAFLFFHHVTGEPLYLERAQLAGECLIRLGNPQEAWLETRYYDATAAQSYFPTKIFPFDQWMAVSGLANLAAVNQNPIYLERAKILATFLMEHTSHPDGGFYPVFDQKTRKPEAAGDKWSRDAGSFLAKSLLALCTLSELTGEAVYRSRAQQIAEHALKSQQPDGRFVTQMSDQSTHLHPHLYTMEGLIHFAVSEDNDKIIDACVKGLEWILRNQNDGGAVFCFFRKKFEPFERVDVLAQTLRMGSILMQMDRVDEPMRVRLKQIENRLLAYQVTREFQKGGFLYGQEENGTIHNHVNSWVTMFAAQALWLYSQAQMNSKTYDFQFFV